MEKVPCVSFSIAFMLSCLHSFPSLASLAFLPSLKVRRLFVKESSLKVQLRSFHCTFWCCLSTKETAFATPSSVTLDFWSSVTLDSSVPELATIGENSNVLLSGEWPKFWMSGDLTTLFFLKLFLVDVDNDHGSSVILTVSSSSEEKESFALNLLSCSEFLAPQLGFSIISSDLWQSIDTEVKKKTVSLRAGISIFDLPKTNLSSKLVLSKSRSFLQTPWVFSGNLWKHMGLVQGQSTELETATEIIPTKTSLFWSSWEIETYRCASLRFNFPMYSFFSKTAFSDCRNSILKCSKGVFSFNSFKLITGQLHLSFFFTVYFS